uniref:ShKT domain-containing protein n=2 Tax=Caenorhabditis tropicalis TaxID=1561998 RepID=A0A1I7UUJ0_9PELO
MKFLILLALCCSMIHSEDNCTDSSDNCPGWAKNGFCTNCFYSCENRVKYCAKTCEYCDGQKTCENCTVTTTTALTTTSPPSTPSTTTINCVDYGDYCKSWAKEGFCTKCFYTCSYRIKYCAKTCGFCTPGACQDCSNLQNFMSILSGGNSFH